MEEGKLAFTEGYLSYRLVKKLRSSQMPQNSAICCFWDGASPSLVTGLFDSALVLCDETRQTDSSITLVRGTLLTSEWAKKTKETCQQQGSNLRGLPQRVSVVIT
jgi:hypothetical protein